jgi:DeoR/GlpR family transcriptional regulator of sugar metabolism
MSDAALRARASFRGGISSSSRPKNSARAPHRVAELKDIDAFVVEHDADPEALSELATGAREILMADRPA